MVWFPCLLSWLRPLTFLISCSCLWSPVISFFLPPPQTHLVIWRGRYRCRYERAEWKHLNDTLCLVLFDMYLGGFAVTSAPPMLFWLWDTSMGPMNTANRGGNTRNCHCVIHVTISSVMVRTRQVDTKSSISGGSFLHSGSVCTVDACTSAASGPYSSGEVCHTYSPS